MLNNLEWSIPMTHGMVWYQNLLVCIDCNHAGTKNVAKEMKKICAGPVKARDKTWFAQLSDKGMCCVVLFFFSQRTYTCNRLIHYPFFFQQGVPKYTCTGA